MTAHAIPQTNSAGVLEQLEKFDIGLSQLQEWEHALGITVPLAPTGEKLYTRQHVNLFRNVKKHLALGRNLSQIKGLIELPPAQQAVIDVTDGIQAKPSVSADTASAKTSNGVHTQPLPPELANNVVAAFSNLPTFSPAARGDADALTMNQAFASVPAVPSSTLHASLNEALTQPVERQVDLNDALLESSPSGGVELAQAVQATSAAALEVAQAEVLTDTSLLLNESLLGGIEVVEPVEAVEPLPAKPELPTVSARVETPSVAVPSELNSGQALASATWIPSAEAAPQAVASALPAALSAPLPAPVSVTSAMIQAQQEQTHSIIERLLNDKEAVQRKLIEAEKLNSHLYSVNNLFNKKVKELTSMVHQLKENHKEGEQMKLIAEKAQLQRKVLTNDRERLEIERKLDEVKEQNYGLSKALTQAEKRLQGMVQGFNPNDFVGQWAEQLSLKDVVFDNFGLNIEQQRQQLRVIETPPASIVGNVAFMTLRYNYPDNPVWQRIERLTLIANGTTHLQGELHIDYLLDGVPVCQAIYAVQLIKQA
ncbi:MAG: hypothetical protein ACKO34_05660 [Vampirovibrionales bacterium]